MNGIRRRFRKGIVRILNSDGQPSNHYFGKICHKHPELIGKRLEGNRACYGCFLEAKKKYREINKTEIARKFKQWNEKNREKRAVSQKIWQQKNNEYIKRKSKIYYEKNKAKKAEYLRIWRLSNKDKVLATATTHKIIRKRLICGQKLARTFAREISEIYRFCPTGFEVDHIIPLRGKDVNGLHVPWNLQYLPTLENRRKHNRCMESV